MSPYAGRHLAKMSLKYPALWFHHTINQPFVINVKMYILIRGIFSHLGEHSKQAYLTKLGVKAPVALIRDSNLYRCMQHIFLLNVLQEIFLIAMYVEIITIAVAHFVHWRVSRSSRHNCLVHTKNVLHTKPHNICTHLCPSFLFMVELVILGGCMWSIYPHSSMLLQWHWGNLMGIRNRATPIIYSYIIHIHIYFASVQVHPKWVKYKTHIYI